MFEVVTLTRKVNVKLGIFLSVFCFCFLVKLQRENALNAEATTQEIKYQHLHVNNPLRSLTACQATPWTNV